ncbi:hypothetical protein AAFC00_004412 [Neodothiora populina]|uniref:Uncharacterized protein n=1 Tax=Neodothiora populina TaxID=2781224 RepID=A0ABR3PQL9_9PEZI
MLRLAPTLGAIFALSSAATAQSTITTSVFGLSNEYGYGGSVIGSDNDAVTYGIECTDGVSCPADFTAVLTGGPSTAQVVYVTSTEGVAAEITQQCELEGTTAATCDVTIIAAVEDYSTAIETTTSLSGAEAASLWIPLTVTAGLEKLAAMTTASATATGTSGVSSGASFGASSASSAAKTAVTSAASSAATASNAVESATNTAATSATPSNDTSDANKIDTMGLISMAAVILGLCSLLTL